MPIPSFTCKSLPLKLLPAPGTNKTSPIQILDSPSITASLVIETVKLSSFAPVTFTVSLFAHLLKYLIGRFFLTLCQPQILVLPPGDPLLRLSQAPDGICPLENRAYDFCILLLSLFCLQDAAFFIPLIIKLL